MNFMTAKFMELDTNQIFVRVERPLETGGIDIKTVSLESFLSCFKKDEKRRGEKVRCGPFPEGLIDIAQEDDTYTMAWFLPTEKRPMQYRDYKGMIWYPSMIFLAKVCKDRLQSLWCLVVDADRQGQLANDSLLYHYPYGNVYSDLHVCLGGNVLTGIRDYQDCARKVQMLFFSAATNDDLYRSSGNTRSQMEEIRISEKADGFEAERLHETGETLGGFLKRFGMGIE